MKTLLFTLTALLGIAIGSATFTPASAYQFAPYSDNAGGGNG